MSGDADEILKDVGGLQYLFAQQGTFFHLLLLLDYVFVYVFF